MGDNELYVAVDEEELFFGGESFEGIGEGLIVLLDCLGELADGWFVMADEEGEVHFALEGKLGNDLFVLIIFVLSLLILCHTLF